MKETIVVIGANHAGTAALNTILDNYKDKEVIAFDSNSNISFLGCGMALWIGKQISGPEGLFYSDKAAFEAKGAKIYMETPEMIKRILKRKNINFYVDEYQAIGLVYPFEGKDYVVLAST